MAAETQSSGRWRGMSPLGWHWFRLCAGPAAAVLAWWLAGDAMHPAARRTAAVAVLMAVYWLTHALPIPATSLLPLVLFPLLGIQTAGQVAEAYVDSTIFLFVGGFVIALGIERWGLHRRIALHVLALLGSGPRQLTFGFMVATAGMSMWVSNTASTLLMMPIGLALLRSMAASPASGDGRPAAGSDAGPVPLGVPLMLGIAYAASIGGLTTLVGTPTNVQFVRIWRLQFPDAPEVSAGEWMLAAGPIGLALLLAAWWWLTRGIAETTVRRPRSFFRQRLRELGRPSVAEWAMLVVLAATAVLWITRKPLAFGGVRMLGGWAEPLSGWLRSLGMPSERAAHAVDDSTVAMLMALLLFVIPVPVGEARRQRVEGSAADPQDVDTTSRVNCLMDWETAERLPWGVLLLIGGGFALAGAIRTSGLAEWIGEQFAAAVTGWPAWMVVVTVVAVLILLTEITSNVATVSALLPILAVMAVRLNLDPRLIMIPATIATSCAFMLPIATPPNAIVFGTGYVSMRTMATTGLWLNVLGTVIIAVLTFAVVVPVLGIDPGGVPAWAAH
ncbi:MAG: SLC13/DASS family transporter [Planctomycetota bacterium]|nr:MAG: SLC13/DASS family transporter [Planctomycetota bacterium]